MAVLNQEEIGMELITRWLKVTAIREVASKKADTDNTLLKELCDELTELCDELEANPDLVTEMFGGEFPDTDAGIPAGQPLSDREKEVLLRSCDEFRLKFLLLMIASKKLFHEQLKHSDMFQMLEGQIDLPNCTIVHGLGGVVYTIINNSCVMLMPDIAHSEQCDLVLQELLNIFDLTGDRSLWAIDFSGVNNFPLALMGTLIGYAQGTSRRRISVCWLKDGLLSDAFMGKVAKFFQCRKVASHWFSE